MGYGYSISDKDTGNLLAHGWGYTLAQGKPTSNNLAEWRALVKGLELLLETGIEYKQLFIYGDSSLVINQTRGRWKVKEGTYAPEATSALKRFSNVFKAATIGWVRREDNKYCDMLSNKYIDHLMREYGFDTGGEFVKKINKNEKSTKNNRRDLHRVVR